MPDIFLSYSRDDLTTARRFAEGFEREGFSVWWDQTLRAGEVYDRVTEKALQDAKAVVVLWSKHSVESHWVRSEATQAQANGTLVPVMIEPCKRPIMFELMHTAELVHWKGDAGDPAWKSFLGDVRQFVKKDGAAISAAAGPPVVLKRRFGVGALAGAVAAVLVASGLGLLVLKHKPDDHPKEVTLAVLPFSNLSSDPEQEYFSDGLTEEILNQLAQIKDLQVTGRTSSFSFKGKNEDLRVIAGKLGVANLLEGSIRKDGNQLRITAQLINGKSGAHMWSHTYPRELKDIFTVQEEIARDVAQALSITLDVGDMSRAQGGTTNLEAYDAYLSARALNRDTSTFMSPQIIVALERAVALDPNYANAWATLATLYGSKSAKGLAAMSRALELAPQSQSIRLAAAGFSTSEHDWQARERQSRAALALAPTDYEANRGYAWFLMTVGRPKDSYVYWERAKRAEPLLAQPSLLLAASYGMAFDIAKSDAELEHAKSLDKDKSLYIPADIEHALLRRDQAALSNLLVEAPSPFELLRQGLANPSVALAGLRQLINDPANRSNSYVMITVAEIAAHLGDLHLALQAVTALSNLGFSSYIWQPGLTQVRQLPGFKDVVRDMKLVDYWRATGNWGDFCKPMGKDDFECH